MLIFGYNALSELLFAGISNCETASLLLGGSVGANKYYGVISISEYFFGILAKEQISSVSGKYNRAYFVHKPFNA